MMMMNGVARAISAYYQSSGGGGGGLSFTEYATTTAPVVSVTTTQDLLPTVGVQTTTSFSSTQPGFWEIASNIPGATIAQAYDGLSATITWTPQAFPVCSIYIAARCWNAGGSSVGVCRAHPGMRGVVQVGSGGDFANLHAAFAAVRGYANPGGYAFVVKNGTYTADNMHIYYDGMGSGPQPYMPPCGEYTSSGSGVDTVYTPTRFTSVIAETPFGVLLDGQGTREIAIELYGNTPYESDAPAEFGDDWHLTATGADMRAVHIAGFACNDTGSGGFVAYYCDNIFFEYLVCGEVSRITPDQNNVAIQFQNSKDCLWENCHTFGAARYNQSCYHSKRIQGRRLFGRKDVVKTNEPHGGIIPYRTRNFRVDNALHFDADQLEEFDTSPNLSRPSQDVGFIGIASTGAHTYPRDHIFNRCLMVNSRLGFSENDAYDTTSAQDEDFKWIDCGAWYYKPNDQQGAGSGIGTWGPSQYEHITSVYCDNVDSQYGCNTWRRLIDISDSILFNFGHQYDGAGRGLNYFGYTDSPTNYLHMTDVTNYGMSVSAELSGNPSYYVKTNVDTTTDPRTQGMRYPGRLEAGSAYKTAHRGQDGFYHSVGPRGYGFGKSGYTTVTNQNWLAEAMMELVLPHYRNYSYTGSTNTQGTQTLTGNRGGAMANKLLIDYVASTMGRDVPFPVSTAIQATTGGHRITWRTFASAYMTNVTGWKIYQDGILIHTTASKNTHAIDVSGLTQGADIEITAVDSVFGESGKSYSVTVP